jgi:hypothetical protein
MGHHGLLQEELYIYLYTNKIQEVQIMNFPAVQFCPSFLLVPSVLHSAELQTPSARIFRGFFSSWTVKRHRITDDELEVICKKAVSGPFETQSRILPGGAVNNHEGTRSSSRYPSQDSRQGLPAYKFRT